MDMNDEKVLLFTGYLGTFDVYRRTLNNYFGEEHCCFFCKGMSLCFLISDLFYCFDKFVFSSFLFDIFNLATQFLSYFFSEFSS